MKNRKKRNMQKEIKISLKAETEIERCLKTEKDL